MEYWLSSGFKDLHDNLTVITTAFIIEFKWQENYKDRIVNLINGEMPQFEDSLVMACNKKISNTNL